MKAGDVVEADPAYRYIYLGCKDTAERYRNQPCNPVLDSRGRCLVGNGNQLVRFRNGERVVVSRRRVRVVNPAVALGNTTAGKCATCDRAVSLVVDHDHATGAFRGLLCVPCNSALDLLDTQRVAAYLKGTLF